MKAAPGYLPPSDQRLPYPLAGVGTLITRYVAPTQLPPGFENPEVRLMLCNRALLPQALQLPPSSLLPKADPCPAA